MKPRILSEIKEDVQLAGLHLIGVKEHKHIRIFVRAKDGRETTVITSLSPGDRRARLNRRGYLRRFAEGLAA